MSIELHIANPDVTDGVLQITWCVSPDTLNELSQKKIKEPVICLITCPDGDKYDPSKEHRQLVLLKDLIAYVQINHSGSNRIYGVLSGQDGIKNAKRFFIERGYYPGYHNAVLSIDGAGYNEEFARIQGVDYLAEPLTVDVPTGAFAKEPAEWEKKWVNHFFSTKPIDQCSFRRRRMFAYGVQPILIVLMMLVRLFPTLFALLIGSRNFSFNYLIHPLRYEMSDASDLFGNGIIFYPKSEDEKGNWRDFILVPLMPLILILASLLIFAIIYYGLWLTILLALAIAACIIPLVMLLVGRINTWLEARLERFSAWYLDKNELPLITCSSDKKPLNWQNLPSKHKTIWLRFQNIKSHICRPFSR